MPKQKESKYARQLRDLGFKPYTEILSKKDNRDVDKAMERIFGADLAKLTRKDRRRLVSLKELPSFLRHPEGTTWVMDELGVEWGADCHVDLTPFGFYDNAKELGVQTASAGQHKMH
jgi:predicted Ser/Thr protein kinase